MQKTDARQAGGTGESKLHFLDYWRVIRVRLGIVLLSFLLVLLTAAAVTYFMPKKYKATQTLELRANQDSQQIFGPDKSQSGPAMDPRFIETQTTILRSQQVLYPVVDGEDLTRRWAVEGNALPREAAFYRLSGMISLKPVRNTEMVELDVTSTSPDEALKVSNAVVQAYKAARQKDFNTPLDEGLRQQEETVNTYRQKVHELEGKLAQFRREHPEVRLNTTAAGMNTPMDPLQGEIDAQQTEVNKYTDGITGLESQLRQVEKLKGDELMRALPTLHLEDPTVQQVLPKYQEAVSGEEVLLNSGVGQNHPKIKALRAAKDVFTRQLKDQIESIRHSLAIQLEITHRTLDGVAKRLVTLHEEQRSNRISGNDYEHLNDEYAKSKMLLDAAEIDLNRKRANQKMPIESLKIWNPAQLPTSPSSPRVPLNMAIGTLIGLIVGVGLAFFIEYLDTSVKTMEDVETMLGVPVLAIVPKNIRLLHKQPGDVPDAEAYRILRTNIEFNRKSADANTISMVSGGPGEGKSTTLCNLAFTCAQGGYSVLIVDADLRRPTQHKLFEINNNVGLTNYLTTNVGLEEVIVQTAVENLSLMPSGILPADAVGILNSQRMSDMIAELKTRYDIVFFDSPPILGVSDGAVLASEVDQSIIIVQHRRFPRAMLVRVKQAISNVGGTVLGVVLNNVDLRHDPNYAYYTSYYEYYAVRAPKEAPVSNGASSGGKRAVPVASSARANGKSNGSSSEY